ncbi:MAG: T9SS type A sorting domain-containing protein [Bacteroidota bacterium]
MKKIFICFILILSFPAFAFAEGWTATLPKTSVNCFLEGNGFLLIGTSHGIYKSTDNGKVWRYSFVGRGDKSVQSVFKLNNEIIALTRQNVLSSSDNGNNWEYLQTSGLPDFKHISKTYAHKNYLFGITGGKVYRSRDARNWETILDTVIDGKTLFIKFIDSDNKVLLALSQDGDVILKSSDDGDSWTNIKNGLPVSDYQLVAVYKDNYFACCSDSLFRSTNQGVSWQKLNNFPSGQLANWQTDKLYAISANNLYSSADSGDSWQLLTDSFPQSDITKNLIYTLSNDLLYNTFRSSDGGSSWYNFDNGLPNMQSDKGYSIYSLDNSILAYSERLFRSDDNADSWKEANMPASEYYDSLLVDSNTIFLKSKTANDTILFYSKDKGNTWHPVLCTFPDRIWYTFQKAVISGDTLVATFTYYMDSTYKYYISYDFGNSWQVLNIDTTLIKSNLNFVNSLVLFAYTDDGKINSSKDAGESFELISTLDLGDISSAQRSYIRKMNFQNGFIYAVIDKYGDVDGNIQLTDVKINYSKDFGNSWDTLKISFSPEDNFVNIARNDNKFVFATFNNIYLSSQSASDTININKNVPISSMNDLIVAGDNIYVSVYDGGIFKMPRNSLSVEGNNSFKSNLSENYPNPFSESTIISFEANKNASGKILIYNSFGCIVYSASIAEIVQGKNLLKLNMGTLYSGVYHYQIVYADKTIMGKFIKIK